MKTTTILLIALTCSLFFIPLSTAQEGASPEITIIQPQPGSIISTSYPDIEASFTSESEIDQTSIEFIVGRFDVTTWDETTITQTSIKYTPPEIFKLQPGLYNVTLTVADIHGNRAQITWNFTVDPTYTDVEEATLDVLSIIYYIIIGTVLFFIGFVVYILYLKKTKRFTFHKYFVQHPTHKQYLSIYVPFVIAFVFTILALAYVSVTPDASDFAMEYVVIVGVMIGAIPYTIDSLLEKRRIFKYEKAFSQFLFEMADAMRGGLDPTKAIIELSKTDTGILKNHLQKAADNIKLGRPFDEVMQSMVRPMKSDLVQRYARLIGETSKVGGETAQVIHRTAKDMDDFIKINQERRRQLTSQVTTIYIAFSVLLIILYQLITMFPSIGSIDISLLSASSLEQATSAQVGSQMSILTMKRRFFHLVLINSLGTGLVIGEFVEGKIKYGLIHSLIMIVVSVLFFALLII